MTVSSLKGFGALSCLDLLTRTRATPSISSTVGNHSKTPQKKTYPEAYEEFMTIKAEVQRITKENGTPRYVLKSYETMVPQKSQILQILDTKPDNEGYFKLHGLVNYENGQSRVFTLSIPKSKDQHDDIQFDQRSDLVTQFYSDPVTQAPIELKQKIRYRKLNNQNDQASSHKTFKVVETIVSNKNFSITAMIAPDFKSFLMTMTHVDASKAITRKFSLAHILKSSEITQVLVNKSGTRISVITTDGNVYWYDIKYTLSDDAVLALTVENLKIGIIPTNEFQRVLYINYVESSEN